MIDLRTLGVFVLAPLGRLLRGAEFRSNERSKYQAR
jgi:hypothetical protein